MPYVTQRSLADLISLNGRVAIVTGAARGIGEAIARRLAEAGARVLLADADVVAAEGAAARIGAGTLGIGLDVSDPDAAAALPDVAARLFGHVDILVNNAGIYPMAPLLETSWDVWQKVLAVNLSGAFVCAQALGRQMADRGSGVIVNLCSIQSLKASAPGMGVYTASKHGLAGLTKCLALELGPAGVRVLGIAPTLVDTPGIAEQRPIFEAAGIADVVTANAAAHPLRRLPTADDIAQVVVFAASDMASSITGSLILTDAGAMCL